MTSYVCFAIGVSSRLEWPPCVDAYRPVREQAIVEFVWPVYLPGAQSGAPFRQVFSEEIHITPNHLLTGASLFQRSDLTFRSTEATPAGFLLVVS